MSILSTCPPLVLASLTIALGLVGAAEPARAQASVPWPDFDAGPDRDKPMSIHPARPIAGDPVMVWVPSASDGDDPTCRLLKPHLRRARGGGVTSIRVTQRFRGGCTRSARAQRGIDLGQLPAGSYAVIEGGERLAFHVLPASAHPGPLPLAVRIRLAVVESHPPKRGCEVWSARLLVAELKKSPTLRRQLAAWYPDKTDLERATMIHLAKRIHVVRSATGYTYSYTSSACCTDHDLAGTVTVDDAGVIAVAPPTLRSSRQVPC